MKKTIRKWTIRLSATVLVCLGMLFTIVMKPSVLYAHKTTHHNYTILHQRPLDSLWMLRIDQATVLLKNSELYDTSFSMNICLNDGSKYPALIEWLQGKAFARGFHSKIVLYGISNCAGNYTELNGRKWNLSQLLAHEAVHCLQYNKYGLWRSKPVADIPNWKWEGYPEYIARHNPDQRNLFDNIHRVIEKEQTDHKGWIDFEDGSGTSLAYYKNWLLVCYCMEIKKMSFDQLLKDKEDYQSLWKGMMNWYYQERNDTGGQGGYE